MPVSLQLNWQAQPEYGGFYQAKAEGLYEAAGLDVTLPEGGSGIQVLQLVATGKVDFATVTTTKLIPAIDKGLPLVAIAAFRQQTLRVLLLHEDHPAQSFQDLNSVKLKARIGDLWLRFLQDKYQHTYQLIPHDFSMVQFLKDPELVQQGLLTSEPFYLEKQNLAFRVLNVAEAGFDNMDVLVTHRDMVKNNPNLVQKVVNASIQGWYHFLNKENSIALDAILATNATQDPQLLQSKAKALIDLYKETNVLTPETIAAIEPKRIAEQITMLEKLDEITPGKLTPDAIADWRFIENLQVTE